MNKMSKPSAATFRLRTVPTEKLMLKIFTYIVADFRICNEFFAVSLHKQRDRKSKTTRN